jgi:hypothetical protein
MEGWHFFLNNRANINVDRTIKIRIHSVASGIVSGSLICVEFGVGEVVGLGVGVGEGDINGVDEGVGVGLGVVVGVTVC